MERNFYVQGNRDSADLIRKSFESLGFITSTYLFTNEDWIYYTIPSDKYVHAVLGAEVKVVFDGNPTYTEIMTD